MNRRLTDEERRRHAEIREAAMRDFPPRRAGRAEAPDGLPQQVREARQSQGLTWYALAERAGIPDQSAIRDLEAGRDVKLSEIEAIAAALGLRLELVSAPEQS